MDSLIVLGLGNPGTRYDGTRHNLGFRVLDRLARNRGARFRVEGESGHEVCTVEIEGGARSVVLAKPSTYMNRSGGAALVLCLQYGASPSDLLVVYDDADLEFGRVRVRPGGGAGGHNGMKSLIEVFGTDQIPRIRLGVRGDGRNRQELAEYVLSPFEAAEQPLVEALADLGAEAAQAVIEGGVEAAMNRYNSRSVFGGERGSAPPGDGRTDG